MLAPPWGPRIGGLGDACRASSSSVLSVGGRGWLLAELVGLECPFQEMKCPFRGEMAQLELIRAR